MDVFRIAQVSDLHLVEPGCLLSGGIDTAAFATSAVAFLNRLVPRPDLVLVTGDGVDGGTDTQYEFLKSVLSGLSMPFRLLAGNHDVPDRLVDWFPDEVVGFRQGRVDGTVDGPVRVVALDSSRPGVPSGSLDAAQLSFLQDELHQDGSPVIVALHHQPFRSGLAAMDRAGLDEASRAGLAQVVSSASNVVRVACGHLHRTLVHPWANTLVSVAPSTAHALTFNLAERARLGWCFEPPAVLVHEWHSEDGMVTHHVTVGDFPDHPVG
jgi:3',5'-cyclic AMP phosphodiesterase CpdA